MEQLTDIGPKVMAVAAETAIFVYSQPGVMKTKTAETAFSKPILTFGPSKQSLTSMDKQTSRRRYKQKIILTRLVVLAVLTPFVVYFLKEHELTTYFLPIYGLVCLLVLIYRVRS